MLLTGARGLLGRYVVDAWDDRAGSLVAVGRRHEGRDLDLSRPGDALLLVEQVQPDVVLHLAGGPRPDVSELYARNVLTGLQMLEACASSAPAAQVVLVGSAAEYGGSELPITEDAPLAPVSEYGRAKAAQTRVAQAVAARDGLAVTVLRPFNVVAADLPSSSALGNLRRQLLAGQGRQRTVVCGRTDVRRDFVAAADVAGAMLALAVAPPGGVLNLCSGTGSSVNEVLQAMCRLLDVEVRIEMDPVLAALPAGDTVVGDPTRLNGLGLALDGSPAHIAAAVLGPLSVTLGWCRSQDGSRHRGEQ
ncbi:MAG: NAD-dependent epimerase/dehydratase family protein [Pseudorhodobacter sp.]|nr:NAD-dependent epimerase/dehydratase family protein [Frankiaceae bacterium]